MRAALAQRLPLFTDDLDLYRTSRNHFEADFCSLASVWRTTRQASVAGMEALSCNNFPDIVLIICRTIIYK